MAAANSIEFGMPVFDISAMDPGQTAIKLVSEELVRKHLALPLFKRGKRLFVGISDPTNTRALDDFKFQTNLAVEAILVDEDRIKAAIDKWLERSEEHTSELQSLMRISYAVFCLKKTQQYET